MENEMPIDDFEETTPRAMCLPNFRRLERVSTLEALRRIKRAPTVANILGREAVAQLDKLELPQQD